MAKKDAMREWVVTFSGGATVSVKAACLLVNHRGDLLFCQSDEAYIPKVLHCFRTGTWLRAQQVENAP